MTIDARWLDTVQRAAGLMCEAKLYDFMKKRNAPRIKIDDFGRVWCERPRDLLAVAQERRATVHCRKKWHETCFTMRAEIDGMAWCARVPVRRELTDAAAAK